jgi:CheY-like chemotaxis protein
MNRPLVLVVEDNVITAKMLQVTLQTGNYRVLVAHDAATALQLVADAHPDLILQDLLLPDMDGVELLRRIRDIPDARNTPVIVCSGLLSKIEEARSGLAPFTDYLFKPVDVGQLLQSVRRLLPEPQTGAVSRPYTCC